MNNYSFKSLRNRIAFFYGMKDGIPIGLGYFAVAFSLGIIAKNAGLTPFQGLLASFLCLASAGEYVGFTLIAANAAYLEIALATFVTNIRYLLMSCALSQRIKPNMPLPHRLLMAYPITDEIFGISISKHGYLNPFYTYGAAVTAAPFWAVGTMIGIIAGNVLPLRLVSAFSVALYGMFLAVIIPPARKSRVIAVLIIICFMAGYAATYLPVIAEWSAGTRTVVLTVLISSIAALLFPKNVDLNKEHDQETEQAARNNTENPLTDSRVDSGENSPDNNSVNNTAKPESKTGATEKIDKDQDAAKESDNVT